MITKLSNLVGLKETWNMILGLIVENWNTLVIATVSPSY